ncbi:MAG: PilZ domain-containing protein [Bauldia sp.]|nr:PilZ domain-containing protein [Bauldia sp.]MCW5718717.1 PilZ domain-containing protein [Bauldia sp.]
MATQDAAIRESLLSHHDRRRHQRVRLSLLGRFMLENRREYPCQTLDMSPASAALISPVVGAINERVVAYIDHVGRIEGRVARLYDGGFAMSIVSTPRKKDKLAAKLTWLANRYHLNLAEDRRHERILPATAVARVFLPDGRDCAARILDLSLSGASLGVDIRPPIGSPIRIGVIRAIVVRHSEDGIAVEFAVLQTPESLEEGLDGTD